MIMKKGIVTLTALILLSGLLALILLFDEQIFAFFRSQMSQRKYYVEQSLALQIMGQRIKWPILFGVNVQSYLRNRPQKA